MGNQQCCKDNTKAGEFHKRPQGSANGTAVRIDNSDYYNQRSLDNHSNDPSRPTKADLGILKSNLKRKQSGSIKLDDSHSISVIKNVPETKQQTDNNSFTKEAALLSPEQELGPKQLGELLFKKIEEDDGPRVTIPRMLPPVQATLEENKFFSEIRPRYTTTKKFGDDTYLGEVDKDSPHGFGRFYKLDGSLYIGHFQNGKAQGKGVYIFPNGSFYEGLFDNNKANDKQARYQSEELTYKGAFKDNNFHGEGEQKGIDHKFAGVYTSGYKSLGKFEWYQDRDLYNYEGPFNEVGEFHGKGRLSEPNGEYQGQFWNSYKHGDGVYKYNNGIKYDGNYLHNKREGRGKLINPNNKIAYEGTFSDGLPHGEGIIQDKDGLRHTSRWIMGIDSDVL